MAPGRDLSAASGVRSWRQRQFVCSSLYSGQMERRILLIDVFGREAMKGNQLAVVVDSDGLSDEAMLEITRWFGFSETTFLLPPSADEADYRVRIFTLAGELPFAGHPTLGTCHAWAGLTGGSGDEAVQECGAGLVKLANADGRWSFEAPPLIRSGEVDPVELAEFAHVLGIDVSDIVAASWADNGPGWVGILVRDAETALALEPDFSRHPKEGQLDIGVVGFHPTGSETLYEVRAFFSDQNGKMLEDPVTGSLNASLAGWLVGDGRASPPYVASQGTALGRRGRVHITGDADSIWVGGNTFTISEGTLYA